MNILGVISSLDFISDGKFCWIFGLCYLEMFSFIKVDLVCAYKKYEFVKDVEKI